MNQHPLFPRRARDILATAVLGLLMLGCESASNTVTFKDQGKLCVHPGTGADRNPFATPARETYEANRPLDLTVVMPRCLSSSCSHDAKAGCTAVVNGNVIEVTSTGSVREQGDTCTADCGALVAKCSTTLLAAGTYQIRHGATRLDLTIPSMTATPCGGEGSGGAPVTP